MQEGLSTLLYVAIDGDDVGIKIRDRIVANDIAGVALLSERLSNFFSTIAAVLEEKQFAIIFCGGDSILATSKHDIAATVFKAFPSGPCTVSAGIAETAERAYLALQLAKARGKNQVVHLVLAQMQTVYDWRNLSKEEPRCANFGDSLLNPRCHEEKPNLRLKNERAPRALC